MANHVHVVVEAGEQVPAEKLLRDFKSYSTRSLRSLAKNRKYIPWTEKGSKRLLPNESALEDAIKYVQHQPKSLVVFVAGMKS
jgi:REP element-mobilizing transposase RayT